MPAREEARGLEPRSVDAVETAGIHRDPVRLRTRNIKRVHAAMRAERMLRDTGLECVDGQRILALQQLEILDRHWQMQNALLGAYRAVALRQEVQIDPCPETHSAAMAAALGLLQHSSCSLGRGRPRIDGLVSSHSTSLAAPAAKACA